jgi:FkbM family methyltransferase
LCLRAYRVLLATGLFKTSLGKWLFVTSYGIYKQRFEAGTAEALRPWVLPGSMVVDVGANIGFFTVRFARWAGIGGRVVAIEPEADNLRMLRQQLLKNREGASVEVIEGVAADHPGILQLVVNPDHPADHRIGAIGVPVRAWTIDEVLAARNWPQVSLIKIDVQGAEVRVLRGARETIRRFHPALFVEVDDQALLEAGHSADILLDEIETLGYGCYDPADPMRRLTRSEASERRQALGYADYLCHI